MLMMYCSINPASYQLNSFRKHSTHIFIVPSTEAEIAFRPFCVTFTFMMESVWPGKVPSQSPLSISHTLSWCIFFVLLPVCFELMYFFCTPASIKVPHLDCTVLRSRYNFAAIWGYRNRGDFTRMKLFSLPSYLAALPISDPRPWLFYQQFQIQFYCYLRI